jgi:hypothetical protein
MPAEVECLFGSTVTAVPPPFSFARRAALRKAGDEGVTRRGILQRLSPPRMQQFRREIFSASKVAAGRKSFILHTAS